ncbi:protein far1-related sequence 5 [Hordeum vulgare]|nr:protein far1-related sequence 5 [Hordeum vulgare]
MVHPHGAEHQPHQSFTELLLSVSRIRSIEPDPCLPQKSKDGLAEIGPEEQESSGEQTLHIDQHLQWKDDVSTDPIMEVDESLPPCEDGSPICVEVEQLQTLSDSDTDGEINGEEVFSSPDFTLPQGREAQPQTRRASHHPPVQNDQCRAMELAIANVLRETIHRWCKWHVLHRAKETLVPAYTMNKTLRDELQKILEYMPTVKEFEAAWKSLVQKYTLHEHPMMTQLYELRKKWAKPYFLGVLYARMTSTQRSESANHMLKNFVPPGASMHMFIKHYQKLQFDHDAEENFAEKKSRLVSPVLKSGLPLERHDGKVYTPALFKLFQEACFKSASYYVENTFVVNDTYCVTHLYVDRRESWSKTSYQVKVQQPGDFFQCKCGMYEHMGLLCCHAIGSWHT